MYGVVLCYADSCLVAVGLAAYLYRNVAGQDRGDERMGEIASAIKVGAKAYLKRQNMTLAVFVVVMAVVLGVLYAIRGGFAYGGSIAMAYIFGSVCTTIAAYIGMMAAVEANVRTANAAKQGLKKSVSGCFLRRGSYGLICCRRGFAWRQFTVLCLPCGFRVDG